MFTIYLQLGQNPWTKLDKTSYVHNYVQWGQENTNGQNLAKPRRNLDIDIDKDIDIDIDNIYRNYVLAEHNPRAGEA